MGKKTKEKSSPRKTIKDYKIKNAKIQEKGHD